MDKRVKQIQIITNGKLNFYDQIDLIEKITYGFCDSKADKMLMEQVKVHIVDEVITVKGIEEEK